MEETVKNSAMDSEEIVIDDGRKRIPIKNQIGEEIGVFYFNPTDFGILKRAKEVTARFDNVTEPLRNVNIDQNGEGVGEADIEAIEEAERRLYEECDYLFGGNLSKAFFGKVNPFSPVNGQFYCETALETVLGYISKKFDAESEKISKRVDKYTHGVRTGKHKDGKM